MCVFYCLVVSNKDNSWFFSYLFRLPTEGLSYHKSLYVAIYLLCNTLYSNNGHCPDLKGKSIHSSHMHAENVPEWVNSSARDRK